MLTSCKITIDPAMYEPVALILCMDNPIPPADWEIFAVCFNVLYIPSMLSSCIVNKKHEDSWGFGVPELNNVGVAWVKYFFDIKVYVSIAASRSSKWIPIETLINICWGLSTVTPFNFRRYDLSSVLNPK